MTEEFFDRELCFSNRKYFEGEFGESEGNADRSIDIEDLAFIRLGLI